jgi:hypothetical protein
MTDAEKRARYLRASRSFLVPKNQIDLSPYAKHVARLYAQAVEEMGSSCVPTLQGMMEGDFQILAVEDCLLTNEEFDEREKTGRLPDRF